MNVGGPHLDDASCASFNSQISNVFKVAGREGLFIAMADRWMPGTPVDARLADIFTRVIAANYAPDQFHATEDEHREIYEANQLEGANTSIADYVWLPLRLEAGRVFIGWRDCWTV